MKAGGRLSAATDCQHVNSALYHPGCKSSHFESGTRYKVGILGRLTPLALVLDAIADVWLAYLFHHSDLTRLSGQSSGIASRTACTYTGFGNVGQHGSLYFVQPYTGRHLYVSGLV